MWFLTVDPFVRISVFTSDYTAGVSSRTFTVKKDLNGANMDTLTKSCSPTMVITANGEVQTHEKAAVYVKELDMFLLIMCIDAPESTTNSRSSNLRVDAGKHLFSEGEKKVALFFFL